MDTDALLRRSLEAWTPGRYDIISTAELDMLGGGTDWDTAQVSQMPAWMTQDYREIAEATDAQLLAKLRERLLFTGATSSVVNQIVHFFDGRATDGTPYASGRPQGLLWHPASTLSHQIEATHMLDRLFDKVADDIDRAVQASPTAPGVARRPTLLTPADVPNFTPSGKWSAGWAILTGTNPLMGPLGGTQKLFAVVADYGASGNTNQRVYDYDLYLVVGDDFGVDEQDVTKHHGRGYADGLAAMWRLQHMRGRNPFINFVLLKRRVHGRIGHSGEHRISR